MTTDAASLWSPNGQTSELDLSATMASASYPETAQISLGASDKSWRYEMRREAQLILPNLYLGGYQSSRSIEGLKGLAITHIVCIRDQTEALLVKPRFPDHFHYLTLEVSDNEDQNLIRIFPTTATFISQAISAGGTVLVHCNGGIALAPAIVVGYVMWAQQVSWEDALRHTQQKRYCMSLNLGFLNQLREYESFCRASFQLPRSSSMDSSSRPSKRSGDDISDDDDDDGMAMDDGAAQTMDLGIDPATGRREHRPERRVQRLGT